MENISKCKVALIDQSGKVDAMGTVGDGIFHVDYLYDYINDKYYNDPEFSSLENEYRRDVFAFHLGNYGYVVFYNGISEGFQYGMFYFPKELTAEQLKTMRNLDLGNQKVAVCYDLEDFGTFIHSNMLGEDGSSTLKEVLDEYSELKPVNEKSRQM